MRVLFLDIDGIVAPQPVGGRVNRKRIHHLNAIIRRTGAVVVLISDWRRHLTRAQIKRIFYAKGFKGRLIGATPVLWTQPGHYPRGDEVRAWLAGYDHPDWPRTSYEAVEAFAILDDRNYYGDLEAYRVQPDSDVGLTKGDIARIVKIMGKTARLPRSTKRHRYAASQ